MAAPLLNTGLVWQELGDEKQALQYLHQARNILRYDLTDWKNFRPVTDLTAIPAILDELINFYTAQQSINKDHPPLRDSIHFYHQCRIALEDYVQREYVGIGIRQYYAERSIPVYEKAISFLLQNQQRRDSMLAFALFEKTKNRQLAEKIRTLSSNVSFNIPDSLLRKEHSLDVDISYLEKKHSKKNSKAIFRPRKAKQFSGQNI